MADNITYRFIQNVGDYFPMGYFTEDFVSKVQTSAGRSADEMKELCTPYVQLRAQYEEYKNFIINAHARREDEIKHTHDWHTLLLNRLGYNTTHAYEEPYVVKEGSDDSPTEIIPVRHILRSGEQVTMLVMEMQHLIAINDNEPDGLFKQQYEDDRTSGQQRYYGGQWRQVIPAEFLNKEKYHFSPAIINKAITQIFLMPEERRPHYILLLAGNMLFLFDRDKWARGSYLQFSLDDLYFQAQIKTYRLHYALFHLLCCKETLAADGQTVLMDTLIEESYKNAYEVTKDLKEGVIFAVETLANEALYYMRHVAHRPFGKYDKETDTYDETDDSFENEVKDDCLTIVYRLLFLFYAESRDELEILPTGDEVYKLGYSLESLRDLEMMRLNSDASRNGYFFDHSIRHLFSLLCKGHHVTDSDTNNKSFRVRPIDSPLFDNKNLRHLGYVRVRNVKWQEIIRALSLSKKKGYRGRISYANLGVNQLGSVYESLLAYRGFYAEEDYIEVHKAGKPEEGTYLIPYSRMGDFDMKEVLCDGETGAPQILTKGTFVYRLNGRDRQKSASYYTPEVLTRSTVKYTLKSIIDDIRLNKRKATDLLELKILEPAMGAAAFQNEVINQVAEAYLEHQQRQLREEGKQNWRIQPDRYRDELQKVKAYIATHNVYGVDLNPTAVELGKLSLWLNVIHKDMETPFFANRICVGNAVIGAWLKTYHKSEVVGIAKRSTKKLEPNKWWERAPRKVKFFSGSVNRSVNEVYHFLLPDANMLGVRSIKEQKKANAEGDKRMANILKDWTAPLSASEFPTLQRLSAKIDVLLKEYYTDQVTINKYTQNRRDIWDGHKYAEQQDLFKEEQQAASYDHKQRLFDTRYGHNNAYRKLKLAMDYWCSLWFWEYADAKALPTREEYWADIEALLNVDDSQLDARTRRALAKADSPTLFDDEELDYTRISEEESEIVARTQEEILTEAYGKLNLFADDDPLRLKIADRLAKRYRFFHPMLEFLEVFWLRDGFDIICGNPPWVLPAFDILGVLSERFPEVILRNMKAPAVRANLNMYFEQEPALENIYNMELIESTCANIFTNSACLYPYLKGIKTDLYMCILESSYDLISDKGYIGMVHPESIYDAAKLNDFRNAAYHRLRYHFQYHNELTLFAEVHHETTYGVNIYGSNKEKIGFYSMHNLFHPNTVDGSFVHNGDGACHGMKLNGQWNIKSHRDRIVYFDDKALDILSEVFEDNDTTSTPKLVNTQTESTIKVLGKLGQTKKHVRDYENIITVGFNETTAVDDGYLSRVITQPKDKDVVILNGPSIYVCTPFYKMPRKSINNNSSYDVIDYNRISENFVPTTCFSSLMKSSDLRNFIKGFRRTTENEDEHDCWLDYYKLAISEWVGSTSERTLSGGIIPPGVHHIGTIVSTTFKNSQHVVELCGLINSIVLDFYMKTTGASHVKKYRIESFPLGVAPQYQSALYSRTLLLNCLTTHYADLWRECWRDDYAAETWSIRDPRLKPFKGLTQAWEWATPLRNYFERRQALVEIDVIAAMALGLSLEDLEMIYNIQFPVLQQNENDTWYDRQGNIVFTCSRGLTGVGVDRKTWEAIRGEALDNLNNPITAITPSEIALYKGTSSSYAHTIDPAQSELYGGQEVTYLAPYTRPDRIADYRRAWGHFEQIFKITD